MSKKYKIDEHGVMIIPKWREFFELSEEDRKRSRIDMDEFMTFITESTHDQREQYHQYIHGRMVLNLGKEQADELVREVEVDLFSRIKIVDGNDCNKKYS
jgi:hypothetical protein